VEDETYPQLMDRVADRDEPWLVLTDEEWYVVTAAVADEDRLMPLEVLDTLPEHDRLIAARTAHRSLLARGLIAMADEPPGEDHLAELEVRAPLITVLDLLGTPWPTVLATSEVDGVLIRRVLLTLGERAVLEHECRGGIHRFALFTPRRATLELAAFLDPRGAAVDTEELELLRAPIDGDPPPRWEELRARIDAADASAQLLAIRDEGRTPDRLLLDLATVDEGLVLVTGEHPDGQGHATEVVARRCSSAMVLGLAAHALSLEEVVG
jgi:hypothetical protein